MFANWTLSVKITIFKWHLLQFNVISELEVFNVIGIWIILKLYINNWTWCKSPKGKSIEVLLVRNYCFNPIKGGVLKLLVFGWFSDQYKQPQNTKHATRCHSASTLEVFVRIVPLGSVDIWDSVHSSVTKLWNNKELLISEYIITTGPKPKKFPLNSLLGNLRLEAVKKKVFNIFNLIIYNNNNIYIFCIS